MSITVAGATDVVLSTVQNIDDNTLLTFSWPEDDNTLSAYDEFGGANTGVVVRHITSTVSGGAKLNVQGYIQVSSITKTDTLDIYINDLVNVS